MKTIKLNGKDYPIRMSYGAIRKTQLHMKREGLDASTDDLEIIPVQIFYGLQAGAKKISEKFEYEIEDVEEWLDDLDINEVTKIANVISEMITGEAPESENIEKIEPSKN